MTRWVVLLEEQGELRPLATIWHSREECLAQARSWDDYLQHKVRIEIMEFELCGFTELVRDPCAEQARGEAGEDVGELSGQTGTRIA